MSATKKGKSGKCLHLPNALIGGLMNRRFSNRSVILAALAGLVLVLLGPVAGSASADPYNPTVDGAFTCSGGVESGTITGSGYGSNQVINSFVVINGTDVAQDASDYADGSGNYTSAVLTFTPGAATTYTLQTRRPTGAVLASVDKTVDCGAPSGPTPVTPQAPTTTTPSCTDLTEVVTPQSQAGVVWSPSGPTTLQPGDPSVDYTATPDSGYTFTTGAQTLWSFTNDFDASTCTNGPIAGFSYTASGLVVQFDGSLSVGTGLSYTWDFGDGHTATGITTEHVYAAPGSPTVKLTVTDASGASNTASLTIPLTGDVKVKVAPATGVRAGGTETVTVSVTENGSAAVGKKVAVKVTGANNASGTPTTNSAGQATFAYRANRAGSDKVVATTEGVTASAAVSILRPVERPVLSATYRKGVVSIAVRTNPRIAHHTVTVYRYHKVHGHWKWSRVGSARTAANGRAHLALSLPVGKQRLRAIVSDSSYVEQYSNICSVRVK